MNRDKSCTPNPRTHNEQDIKVSHILTHTICTYQTSTPGHSADVNDWNANKILTA